LVEDAGEGDREVGGAVVGGEDDAHDPPHCYSLINCDTFHNMV
jgi:hypothetical protein